MSLTWTNPRTDLKGSRWDVWKKHFEDTISWDEFRHKVVEFNPHISVKSKWMLKRGIQYMTPIEVRLSAPKAPKLVTYDTNLSSNRVRLAQLLLQKAHQYGGDIDGVIGKNTLIGISQYKKIDSDWPNDQKVVALLQIKAQEKGLNTGVIDGLWGPQTDYAVDELMEYLNSGKINTNWRLEDTEEESKIIWPKQYTQEFYDFYVSSFPFRINCHGI